MCGRRLAVRVLGWVACWLQLWLTLAGILEAGDFSDNCVLLQSFPRVQLEWQLTTNAIEFQLVQQLVTCSPLSSPPISLASDVMQFQGGWVAVGIARSDSPSEFTQSH